jgi:hypothetical protein
LVNTPKIKPKIAGANSEFGPSEIVGVIKLQRIIQVIPPKDSAGVLHGRYQHHKQ